MRADKVVVTGNKALLAEHGAEIFALSEELSVPVFFEASTAGGIPIIKAVREAFVANHFLSFHGIINGTSNYILSRMTEAGLDFPAALAEAQAHGYAEADPTLDVNGWDAAHKAIILASLAYGRWVRPDSISVEGIEKVSAADIRFARQLGYRIKLIGRITADAQGTISVGVHPTLIPQEHVLASVNGVFNAIAVKGDVVGDALFYGRGAGSGPTASAVLADIADAATALVNRGTPRCSGFRAHGLYGKALSPDEVVSRYYLRLAVDDQPGVLGQVARRARPGRDRHFVGAAARAARRRRSRATHPHAGSRAARAGEDRAGGDRVDAVRAAAGRAAASGDVRLKLNQAGRAISCARSMACARSDCLNGLVR